MRHLYGYTAQMPATTSFTRFLLSFKFNSSITKKRYQLITQNRYQFNRSITKETSQQAMDSILHKAHSMIPPLDGTLHKGQAGRIGIMGGSKDYTGAPYFSGYASLKLGVDLTHIICEPSASQVIKTYSPDLMVHSYLSPPNADPKLNESNQLEFDQLLDRLHVLVIGPGLGRDKANQDWAQWAIKTSIKKNILLVLDADALWLLQFKPEILKGYKKVILTPNKVEFQRLLKALSNINPELNQNHLNDVGLALQLSKTLGGCTILLKSATDIVAQDGSEPVEVRWKGSPKRCGGQGDILSGLVGTWLAWTKLYSERRKMRQGEKGTKTISNSKEEKINQHDQEIISPLVVAEGIIISAVLGSVLTRHSAELTFQKFGRSMQSSDILNFIPKALDLYLQVYKDD